MASKNAATRLTRAGEANVRISVHTRLRNVEVEALSCRLQLKNGATALTGTMPMCNSPAVVECLGAGLASYPKTGVLTEATLKGGAEPLCVVSRGRAIGRLGSGSKLFFTQTRATCTHVPHAFGSFCGEYIARLITQYGRMYSQQHAIMSD